MDDEVLLAAFVGPRWETHYRPSFARRAGGGYFRFNWAAFLAPLWLVFRGFWIFQLVVAVVFTVALVYVADLIHDHDMLFTYAALFVALGLLEGLTGDALVHWQARRFVAKARARGLDEQQSVAWLKKRGGVSVLGVTLLPLTAVLLIAAAIPYFGHHDHSYAYVATMKRDLRNLVTAEESYFADSLTYTLHPVADTGWAAFPSTGVTITIGVATATGWNATAAHSALTRTCGIFVGSAPAPVPGVAEGEPQCP